MNIANEGLQVVILAGLFRSLRRLRISSAYKNLFADLKGCIKHVWVSSASYGEIGLHIELWSLISEGDRVW